MKPILILPEGFPVEETKSALICPKDSSDDSSFMWELTLPKDAVPDSGRAYLNLIGDILGPALENLDKLIKLPKGCGEQNMILFVPNNHVIKYLDAMRINKPDLRAKAIRNMEKGIVFGFYNGYIYLKYFNKIKNVLLIFFIFYFFIIIFKQQFNNY